MNVNVTLYGVLSHSLPDYEHQSGLDVIVSDGASINDLLASLDLLDKGVGLVIMNGKSEKTDTPLEEGAAIKIFQPISGG